MRSIAACAFVFVGVAACGGKPADTRDRPDPSSPKKDAALPVATVELVLPEAPPLPEPPVGLPALPERADVTPNLVALGELLFAEVQLSSTAKLACATCHDPAHGFAGTARQDTAAGKPNLRRAPTLVNLAWETSFGWDGRYPSLGEHLAAHARGQLGELAAGVARLAEVPVYRAQFARAGGATADVALRAVGAYVVTRYAGGSAWDKVERAPDPPAELKAGFTIFSTTAQCATCHPPPLYTDHAFHRLGLIALADDGRGRIDPAQKGAFRTPTLRGVGTRAGFFHDGSATTLDAAIDWHLAGGVGQGADPSIVDPVIARPIVLTPDERRQLGAFVRAL
ncbi:MAG: cytochrome-c peroxidase [Proteobacteria bacterium]|nr:cytochrome-c peroxidase [Pseudomonadota bacterium]